MSTPLLELLAGDSPEAWAGLGFAVDAGGTCRVGPITVRLEGGGGGLRGWTLGGPPGPERIDGLPTRWELRRSGDTEPEVEHPNGASAVDHVVIMTGDRERTARALVEAGAEMRRRREPPEVPAAMAFLRLGPVIVEVAEHPPGRARLWGLVVVVPDVDALARHHPRALGEPRDAVQPGRRIVTARRREGLEVPLAFMTPRQR